MIKNFNPDIILIACNTLSVVYPETEFSKTTNIPVIGIVELGVELMSDSLVNNPGSNVFIIGTPTTINSNSHKNKLVAKGFDANNIFTQPCKNLESEIQEDTESKAVKDLLDKYSDEMKSKVRTPAEKTFVGLCCTHYGYAYNLIDSVMKNKLGNKTELLNPNSKMGDLIITDSNRFRYNEIKTNVKVVSQVDITEQENKSLGKLLGKESEKTEAALKNYILKENLFEYKKFVE
jgi:glutamate racemase